MGDVLQPWHYISIGVIVLASLCFAMIDVTRHGRWDSILLMLIVSSIQITIVLIQKYLFEQGDFVIIFMFILIGIVISGLLPLLLVFNARKIFKNNIPKLKPYIPLFICLEFANVFALYLTQKSIDLGSPALTAAMGATIPAYSFLFSLVLLRFKHRFGDEEVRYRFRTKLVLVGIMSVSVMQLA